MKCVHVYHGAQLYQLHLRDCGYRDLKIRVQRDGGVVFFVGPCFEMTFSTSLSENSKTISWQSRLWV